MKTILLLLCCLLSTQVFAVKPFPPDIHVLAVSKGNMLRRKINPSPEGGNSVTFQILNKKKILVVNLLVSDTRFNANATNDVHEEKISEENCRSALKDLEKQIKKYKFKRISIDFTACGKDRRVTVIAN